MSPLDALVWGFVATVALTLLLEASRHAGLSRMSLLYLIGTMFTSNRRRAPWIGAVIHFGLGILFAFAHALTFESLGRANWWIGALAGVVQTAFVLLVISILPGFHPRMATEQDGPQARRALQPPGFLALNYGVRTPLVVLGAYVAYGIILGAFYTVRGAALP